MARIVGEVQPRFVFVENSPMLTSRGLDRVLGDLSTLGYNARWGVLGAIDAGAPHERERSWIVAYSMQGRSWEKRKNSGGRSEWATSKNIGSTTCVERIRGWDSEPDVGRVVNGMAYGMDRYAALGNGQVPAVVKLAWEILGPAVNERAQELPLGGS